VLNFVIIYRGLSKGIELFCKWAMPALIVCALVVLVRVLTLGTPNPAHPDQNVLNGLGYMWNLGWDGKSVWQSLGNAQMWLEAAGQIFFSLSVGFGIVSCYASYLKPGAGTGHAGDFRYDAVHDW
jgi:SNF family Na+-dependent transporter